MDWFKGIFEETNTTKIPKEKMSKSKNPISLFVLNQKTISIFNQVHFFSFSA